MAEESIDAIVGGDLALMRQQGVEPPSGSVEVPCVRCGRPTLIAPASQRIAMGKPEKLFTPKVESGQPALGESAGVNNSRPPVICMWCMFADQPEILALLPPRPARSDAV